MNIYMEEFFQSIINHWFLSIVIVCIITNWLTIIFNKKNGSIFLSFCPIINTVLLFAELVILMGLLYDIIARLDLDSKFYKAIRFGRNKK